MLRILSLLALASSVAAYSAPHATAEECVPLLRRPCRDSGGGVTGGGRGRARYL